MITGHLPLLPPCSGSLRSERARLLTVGSRLLSMGNLLAIFGFSLGQAQCHLPEKNPSEGVTPCLAPVGTRCALEKGKSLKDCRTQRRREGSWT
jgi:hypothetical protein